MALVCPYSLSRPGGVQGQVLGLARGLTARGHVVTVFAPVDGQVAAPVGVEIVAAGHSTSLRANGSVAPVSISPVAVRRALGELRARRPDVVHVHEPFAPGLSYGLLTARDIPPLVGTFHRSGGSALYTVLGPAARRLAARLAVRCAVSDAAAATARAALGGTYELLFNGIDLGQFDGVVPYPTTAPTVLFLGRHEERKGLGVLLDAWDQLLDGGPVGEDPDRPPVLWVAGDGPETSVLRRRHPESDSVHWLGVLDEDDKVRRLVGADVLAAPSLGGESFGLVLLEGMGAGTVVVASDIDGYRDAAGGRAVMVPPGDSRALATGIRGVLDGDLAPAPGTGPDGPNDRREWLRAGTERAAQWSMASLAGKYEDLYRSVLVRIGP